MAFIQGIDSSKVRAQTKFDPRTKLFLLFVVSLVSFLFYDWWMLLFLLEIVLFILSLIDVDHRQVWRFIKPVLWVIGPLFLIQLFFHYDKTTPLVMVPIYWQNSNAIANFLAGRVIISKESLIYAITITIRVVVLALVSCMFSLTTNTNEFLRALAKLRIPYEIVFTTGLVIYFLPMVISESNAARSALETRGLSLQRGSFKARLQTFRVLISSILMNFIEKAKFQAIAMDSRGFNPRKKRTSLNDANLTIKDYTMLLVITGLTVGLILLFWEKIQLFPSLQ